MTRTPPESTEFYPFDRRPETDPYTLVKTSSDSYIEDVGGEFVFRASHIMTLQEAKTAVRALLQGRGEGREMGRVEAGNAVAKALGFPTADQFARLSARVEDLDGRIP